MTVDGFYDFYGQRRPYSCDPARHFNFYAQRPYHNHQSFQTRPPPQRQIIRPSAPKVKSIPVQYVGLCQSDSKPAVQYVGSSRSDSKSDSATKIQKVFRGYLVRKNVKKVKSIAKLVEEIEERIRMDVERIIRDSKERLKVQETLMKLLFQLDSISGVDSGVRICWKKVINKAIALQESVDSIAAVDSKVQSEIEKFADAHEKDHIMDESAATTGTVDCDDQMAHSVVDNLLADTLDSKYQSEIEKCAEAHEEDHIVDESAATGTGDCEDQMADSVVDNLSEIEKCADAHEEDHIVDESVATETVDCEDQMADSVVDNLPAVDSKYQSEIEKCADAHEEDHIVDESAANTGTVDCDDEMADSVVDNLPANNVRINVMPETENEGADRSEKKKNSSDRELLERLVKENGRMMSLMTELFERDRMQMQMLTSLSTRMGYLERAMAAERARRNKKPKKNTNTCDGCR